MVEVLGNLTLQWITGWYETGYMAVCNKVAGEDFFLAVLYHEWFIIEPNPVFGTS
ncbi:MAG: hypothetical protein AAGF01_11530 [Cyanobacteria bacterium P01_G01_bin.38]